jgi:23S rRNA (uracil1939-C5)-methyltransferase
LTEGDGISPQVGAEVDVTIDSIAFGGDGVARHQGFVIFVPDVIPGETVRVRITAAKRSYGRGVPAVLLRPSPDRVEPRCGVYGLCGGCQYQHMKYERSLALKERQLGEVLQRIGGICVDGIAAPIRPAPAAWNYRNAITLKVRMSESGSEVGYFARDNVTFVPIQVCPIAIDAINETLSDIPAMLAEFKRPGKITGLTVRHAGGETLVFPRYQKPYRFASRERLKYEYGDIFFLYGPRCFFQVNHSMIPTLLDLVGEALAPAGEALAPAGETLFDLYAGVGLFSLALAGRFRRVVGIEHSAESVEYFKENVHRNGLGNVNVVRGAVEEMLSGVLRKCRDEDMSVLVDPPREGMRPGVIRILNAARARRLVYVSCDPATLARDLKLLGASYCLRRVTPVDMFPQTGHLEAVAVLEGR